MQGGTKVEDSLIDGEFWVVNGDRCARLTCDTLAVTLAKEDKKSGHTLSKEGKILSAHCGRHLTDGQWEVHRIDRQGPLRLRHHLLEPLPQLAVVDGRRVKVLRETHSDVEPVRVGDRLCHGLYPLAQVNDGRRRQRPGGALYDGSGGNHIVGVRRGLEHCHGDHFRVERVLFPRHKRLQCRRQLSGGRHWVDGEVGHGRVAAAAI
mmetsp:Transcript_4489/g.11888  ORF Transcript_4489/g.11888 Transcript_4489/m.11888 type:complete len:206 (-) Transcript_4489:686-1303(-)